MYCNLKIILGEPQRPHNILSYSQRLTADSSIPHTP